MIQWVDGMNQYTCLKIDLKRHDYFVFYYHSQTGTAHVFFYLVNPLQPFPRGTVERTHFSLGPSIFDNFNLVLVCYANIEL